MRILSYHSSSGSGLGLERICMYSGKNPGTWSLLLLVLLYTIPVQNKHTKLRIATQNRQHHVHGAAIAPSTTDAAVFPAGPIPPVAYLFFLLYILRRVGKNKALAHHTSTYFHTRRVSI